jgi:hypothetical protein
MEDKVDNDIEEISNINKELPNIPEKKVMMLLMKE